MKSVFQVKANNQPPSMEIQSRLMSFVSKD